MASLPASSAARPHRATLRARAASMLQRQGVLVAFVALLIFGGLRYDNFLSAYNIGSILRYNSMIGLVALGMTFVIMTGGIDLSVGSMVALSSVVAAQVSGNGLLLGIVVPVLVGMVVGFINGLVITKLKVLPFIATLAMLLAARGMALTLAKNTSVSIDFTSGFKEFGQGDFLGLPTPAVVLFGLYIVGIVVLNYTRLGRHILAVGGNEEAARLMGLPVDRIKIIVYTFSSAMAALAGVILAAQYNAGQPNEGLGWELSAITAVVIGGTLLTGGLGSVATTLVGVLLLGVIFKILDFENGQGLISLSSYWQSVIRGVFLLIVVLLQTRLAGRTVQDG